MRDVLRGEYGAGTRCLRMVGGEAMKIAALMSLRVASVRKRVGRGEVRGGGMVG